MRIVSCDPGKDGAICVMDFGVYEKSKIKIEVFPYDDDKLLSILHSNPHRAIVESVHAMPHQGVTSMFNFGKSFGYILGVLEANNVPYELVTPQKWKKEFDLIGKDKQASIEKAKELFPEVNLYRTKRCKKEHDGMAESLLLAEYLRRKVCQDT